ncbi:MAG: hypothetical protein KKD26_02380 [Alphaproteobacteria bacterium]|jgi:hypothetical protein|uniref:Uncharacterized protein n=1 Tax=Brevundimonas mediterranea TaxID=74329 RepID=A0A7Z8Y5B7_9CAUL|nr:MULTISPECIES: hypothetical protein [Brevundimonas]MBU4196343.1 hypothetical protein [Alphaproteobacteria bacterium]MBJ7320572.1 hypothetical protein [Brevundimonas sp.]MBU4238086.1 hypothetical protein [Alphaproteobacteria bacterium]MCG2663555.1 hypothetical protein [Brevundimonas sp.]VDC51216.1 hypothetical protein BREV_BREV_02567 [Brevundimonas mediterranea]
MITELKVYLGLCVGMTVILAGLTIWRPDADVQMALIVVPFVILAALARSNLQLAKRIEALEGRQRVGELERAESRT